MLVVFCVWSILVVLFVVMGLYALFAKKAVPFWTVDKDIKVTDWRVYNKKLAILYFVYAVVLGLLGLSFLFDKQNGVAFIIAILGLPTSSILMMVLYTVFIESKYRR